MTSWRRGVIQPGLHAALGQRVAIDTRGSAGGDPRAADIRAA
jgi:hypothetical protein